MVAAAPEDQRLWYDLIESLELGMWIVCWVGWVQLSSEKRNSGGSEQSLLNVVLQQHVSCRGCGRMSSRRVDKKKWRVSRRFSKSTWLVILISTHIYTQCRDMQGLVLRTHCRSALCVLIQRLPKTRDLGTPIQSYSAISNLAFWFSSCIFFPSEPCQDVPRFVGICSGPARTRSTSLIFLYPSLVHSLLDSVRFC